MMQITIDMSSPLTDAERAVLAVLAQPDSDRQPANEEKAPAKRRRKQKPKEELEAAKSEPEAPAEEPEPEAAEDDSGSAEEDPMAKAVELATELVSSGKAAEVKAALTDLGVKRVSELDDDNVGDFIEAIS